MKAIQHSLLFAAIVTASAALAIAQRRPVVLRLQAAARPEEEGRAAAPGASVTSTAWQDGGKFR